MRFAILLFMWSVALMFPLFAMDFKSRDEEGFASLRFLAKVLLISVVIYTGCIIGQLIVKVVRWC